MDDGQKRLSSALQQFIVACVGFLQFRDKTLHVCLALAHSLRKLPHTNKHGDKYRDERTEHTYIIIGISALDASYMLFPLGDAVVHLCVNNGYHVLQVPVDYLIPHSQTVKDAAYLAALSLVFCQHFVLQGGQHFRRLVGVLHYLSGCIRILFFLPEQAFQETALLFLRLVLVSLHQLLTFRLAFFYNLWNFRNKLGMDVVALMDGGPYPQQ